MGVVNFGRLVILTEEELKETEILAKLVGPTTVHRLIAEVRRLQEENATYLKTIDALNGMVERLKATEESLRYCLSKRG